MTTIRKLVRAEIRALGDDEVEVVMSTAALARDEHILIPQGCQLDNYRANPIVLWSHDPDKPVGNAEDPAVGQREISARVRFAPLGISHKADEIRGLVKAGVIRTVSVGFDPIEMEPLDPKKPRGGQRITKWELLELSFVSVPADPGAVVTARSNGETAMATEATEGAQPQTTVPDKKVRAHVVRAGQLAFKRGLYQVASLFYLFEELGWHVDMAKFEAAIEGDASQVPAMLVGVLQDLGDALLAMAEEEIAEALAGHDVEPEEDDADEVLVIEERQHIGAATTPGLRAFRRGLAHAKVRSGKTLSAETVRCLRDVQAKIDEGLEQHRSGMKKHREAKAAIDDMMERAGVSDPESDATQTVQKADGTEVDEGSRSAEDADFRRRQADMLALRAAE